MVLTSLILYVASFLSRRFFTQTFIKRSKNWVCLMKPLQWINSTNGIQNDDTDQRKTRVVHREQARGPLVADFQEEPIRQITERTTAGDTAPTSKVNLAPSNNIALRFADANYRVGIPLFLKPRSGRCIGSRTLHVNV
jgi:hypothetical protein